MSRRVVVVGAGITGLTAAFTLLEEAPETQVDVIEAADRVGGKVLTGPFAGRRVDAAADAFLARVPDGVDLCRRLGLAERLVSPAARTAYLFSRGALLRFPEGLVLGVPTDLDALARSGVLSPEGVARAAEDLTMGPDPERAGGTDESVGSLVRRRLGDEVYDVLLGPLLSGVNAGDADHLSVAAGAPQFAAGLARHGSLIAGARAQKAAATQADPDAPVFFGLPGGTQILTDTLAARITAGGGRIHLGAAVVSIAPAPTGGYLVHAGDGVSPIPADVVILTTPLFVTGPLLAPFAPDVADEMTDLEYASAIMVTLAVPIAAIDHPLDASGFLVAEAERLLLTACSWASSKWAHLADPEIAILRASAGRHHDPRALDLDDDSLVDALLDDLGTTMGVRGRPTETRVTRWERSLPQFRPGHLGRIEQWRGALAEAAPGLLATGAGFEGLGLPACIRQARTTAERALDLDLPGVSRL
jgi:oxygen-dependent protoporphyrinogen oxidase